MTNMNSERLIIYMSIGFDVASRFHDGIFIGFCLFSCEPQIDES